MNKIVLNLFVSCVFVSLFAYATIEKKNEHSYQKKEEIVLVNPIMNLIDGKSFGINANTFGLILQSRREVRKRLIGVVLADKSSVGFYDFEGKKHYLSELVQLEQELANKQDAGSRDRKDSLQKLLNWAIEDFIGFTSEYMDSAKGMKDPLLTIIKEFHSKSGLGEFFLLDWGSLKDGGEMESVKKNVTSFGGLKTLFTEMEGFLEAMARSCPKGKKLFIEMVNAAKHANSEKA